jgi:2-keto-4-pentenoate hydratase
VETWELPPVARGIERQRAAIAERRGRGESVIGWKLGLGSAAVRDELGLPGPLVGFLSSASVLSSGATVAVGEWVRPALEPELAVHVGPPGGAAGPSGAAPSIAAVGSAIEIVDVDVPREDLEAVVGGNIYQRHVILGAPDRGRAGGDTAGISASVTRGDEEVARTDEPIALTGPLEGLTSYVARWLGAMGERLEPGQVIICGSVVPLITVAAGERFVYRCDPQEQLAVSFTS